MIIELEGAEDFPDDDDDDERDLLLPLLLFPPLFAPAIAQASQIHVYIQVVFNMKQKRYELNNCYFIPCDNIIGM